MALAASVLAAPRASAQHPPSDYDCVVIGAGAAGIAAARWLQRRRKRVLVLEARGRVGGRAWTDADSLGGPFDLGAAWLHYASRNPLRRFVPRQADLTRTSTSNGAFFRGGRRLADADAEAYVAAEQRVLERIEETARRGGDAPLAAMIDERDVWERYVVETVASATIGGDPADVSVADLARGGREDDAFVVGGVGALLAGLAGALDIRLNTPATLIDRSSRDIAVTTPAGTVRARTCLVTIPASLLAADVLRISPILPLVLSEAFAALPLGTFEKVAFKLVQAPPVTEDFAVGFGVLEAGRPHAVHIGASNAIATVLYGARWADGIARDGEAAKVAFGLEVLKDVFGSSIEREIVGQPLATAWRDDPWARGSYSYAKPGWAKAREVYRADVDDRLGFAGEADDTSMPSTVGGAWLSGERAARALARRL